MRGRSGKYLVLTVLILAIALTWLFKNYSLNISYKAGDVVDSLNHVYVFYNGKVDNTLGRNVAPDGYNLGLKYQCVEFVKRYYHQHLHHRMPDSYGHAKDFFDKKIKDGERNPARSLLQFSNGSSTKPRPDDLLVFSETGFNPFGHVAIVSKVTDDEIEIIQQNPGPFGKSRENIGLVSKDGKWRIRNDRVLGWLRKE